MKTRLIVSVVGVTLQLARADTLYFRATADQNGGTNFSWLSANNWYTPDQNGSVNPGVHANKIAGIGDKAILLSSVIVPGTVKVTEIDGNNQNITVNGDLSADTWTVRNNGGNFIGTDLSAGSFTVNSSGHMMITGENTMTGTLNISFGAQVQFSTTPKGSLVLSGGSIINNDGEIDLGDGNGIAPTNYGATFNNTGTIKSNGTASIGSDNDLPFEFGQFDNSGLVEVQSGKLIIGQKITVTNHGGAAQTIGHFQTTAANAQLFLDQLTVAAGAKAVFSGPGPISIEAALTMNGDIDVGVVDPSTKVLDFGYLVVGTAEATGTGSGTLHVLGDSTHKGILSLQCIDFAPTFAGLINVDAFAQLDDGTNSCTPIIEAGTINNHGTLLLGGNKLFIIGENPNGGPQGNPVFNSFTNVTGALTGTIGVNGGGTFNNEPGAIFSLEDKTVVNGGGTPSGTFNNMGTFRREGGPNQSEVHCNFVNTGTLEIATGTLLFLQDFTQTSGSTNLEDGTTLWVQNNGDNVVFNGGTLTGNGTIMGNLVNNGAVISPGHSPGLINVSNGGNFTQGDNGKLVIEIAGLTTPGVDFDQVSVAGTANLGGTIEVIDINGFQPNPGDSVPAIVASSVNGQFKTTNTQVNYLSSGITVAALPGVRPTPSPTVTPAAQLLNISTRMEVLTDSNVLIGGFIVTGTDEKKVLVRGLGPSLPVSGALADPTLELHDATGAVVATNDNWKDTQQSDVQATTIPPSNDLESAIVASLAANNAAYTAILAGKAGGTGIGLVEVYDLGSAANSKLANISTRGFIDTGDNVMIGGLILGPNGTGSAKVLVRGLGPSLTSAGVANALADPNLELRDASGNLIATNDNWKDTQQSDIQATTIPPSNDLESAIVQTLAPGNYTAIVRGKNSGTGVGLVELYNLQ